MNANLVKTLAQIIRSLSEEEQTLLESELKPKLDRRKTIQKMQELGDKISVRRGGKLLEPPPEELIRQMREERTEQLIQACCPDDEAK